MAQSAFAALPEDFRRLCDGVVIRVEDFPDDETLDEMNCASEFDLLGLFRGRGRASGVVVEALGAALWTLCGGVVTHLTLYQSRDQALKAVGLADG